MSVQLIHSDDARYFEAEVKRWIDLFTSEGQEIVTVDFQTTSSKAGNNVHYQALVRSKWPEPSP